MSNINLEDEVGLQGILKATTIAVADGKRTELFLDENLIMDRAKAHLLSLSYDRSGAARTDPIKTFQVGSGGVFNINNPAAIKPSNPKATKLYQPLDPGVGGRIYNPANIVNDRLNIDPALLTSSSPTDVTFTFILTPNDLVGSNLNEVGLFTAAGYMFNHKTFPTLLKTSQFSVEFTWTIKYN